MPMGGQVGTLQQQPGLWLESGRTAAEAEQAHRNYLLQNRQMLSQAIMGMIGSLNQYQQQQQNAEVQQQQLALQERQVAAGEADTASQIAARAAQSGKTAAETQRILKDLGYADELIQAGLAQTYAQTEGIKAGTEATQVGTQRNRLMLPGELTQQQQGIQMGEEKIMDAAQQREQGAQMFPVKMQGAQQDIKESEARTGLYGAQTQAAGKGPEGAKLGGWQRSVQEEITQVENSATSRMTQINAILGNKSVVDVMMATPQGKAAIESMTQDVADQQSRLKMVNAIRLKMANQDAPMTEDEAWAMLGRLLAGQQSQGPQPVENAGGGVVNPRDIFR